MASADLAFALELADLADSLSLPRFRALDLRIETKFWDALTDGGEEGPCGWLKDRYGVSWQIVPKVPYELIGDPNREKSQRVMAAMLKMKKIEIAELERAAAAA
jgi:predicted 3-demethylubiquinone-9 3-methyltransferase (glyoxalase superfamily)